MVKPTKKPASKKNSITNYFTKVQRISDTQINRIIVETGSSDEQKNQCVVAEEYTDFYEQFLDEKCHTCGPGKNCHATKRKLKMRLDLMIQKENNIQKAVSSCVKMCQKKDLEIEVLQKQINQQTNIASGTSTSKSNPDKIIFDGFKDSLSDIQLGCLRSLDKSAKGDSTFVINCVRFFYSDDLTKLQQKSLTGISKANKKEPITPRKLDQMKSLFNERLTNMQLADTERLAREKKFNRHIHSAITNINACLKKESAKKIMINVDETE